MARSPAHRIATYGFRHDLLASLNRTARAYLTALANSFTLVDEESGDAPVDARLLFSSDSSPIILKSDDPLIIPLHGSAVAAPETLRRNLAKLRRCDRLIANCTGDISVLSDLLLYPEQTVRLVPLPVNSQVFRPMQKAAARAALGISPNSLVIGFVGRLIPQKGVHYFLDLLSECQRLLPKEEVVGVVVGDYQSGYPVLEFVKAADYCEYISLRVRAGGFGKTLRLLGTQPDDDCLRIIYNCLDVYVHLTHTVDENFGYAPLEAMACGIPVVGTAYGGLRDSVRHQETGYLVPTWPSPGGLRSDFAEAAWYTYGLLSDDRLRLAMGKRARAHVQTNFTYGRFQNLLQHIFDEAISEANQKDRLELLPPVPPTMRKSQLPKSQPEWIDIYPMVERYASGRPRAQRDTRFCWCFGLQKIGNCLYRSIDPAWPAEYRLNVIEQEIVEMCYFSPAVSDVVGHYGSAVPMSLLDQGVLSLQARAPRNA